MTKLTRIVVTGFEPWGPNAENPTLEILDLLKAVDDVEGDLTLLRLPVDSSKIASITAKTLEEVQPDLWISLGLAAGLAVVAVERIAANVMDFAIPDNAGNHHRSEAIFADGPAAHMATLPVELIVSHLRESGIPAKVSNSASTYLCNQMMYTALHLIAKKGMKTSAGFIHVPAHPRLAALQQYPLAEMPSMSVELMAQAVRKAIRISLGARKPKLLQA
jgi:pyroglutamyl-peptidase